MALCLFALTTNGQVKSVFDVPYPERYQVVNDFISAGVDSATDVKTVQTLLAKAQAKGDLQDILNIERAQLVIDMMWKVDTAHFMQRALAIVKKAKKAGYQPPVTFVNNTIGDHYFETHEYVTGFEYYLRAYNDYHVLYRDQFPDMSETQYSLAAAYFKFNDYTNAIKHSKELLSNGHVRKQWINVYSYDLIGTSYLKLKQYDSALVYFRKTLDAAPTYHSADGKIAWRGIASGKMGVALYFRKEYDEAEHFLEQGVQLCTESNLPDNVAPFSIYLSHIYLSRNDKATAQRYLDIARLATYSAHNLYNYFEFYAALSAFYRHSGNIVNTLQYQDSSLKYKDSLGTILDVNKKYIAELRVAEERRSKTEQLANEEKQKQILIRNSLIGLSSLLMLSVLLFFNRKLLQQKYKREKLLSEKLFAENQLNNARQQLDSFKKNIAEKDDLIVSLTKETAITDNAIISKLLQSTILTDDQWEDFRQLFEKIHPDFLHQLKQKLPGLSPAETRYMVLAKLNFTNKEMAATLGVSSQAIRTTWYRMRRKLNLPDEGTIDELMEQIH